MPLSDDIIHSVSSNDLGIIHLAVLVLPGLWGFWVYKNFIKKSTEDVQWDKDLFMGISFALPGYLFARYFFPGEASNTLFPQFMLTAGASILLGTVMGCLALRFGIRPTYLVSTLFSRWMGRSVETPHGRGISYVLHSHIEPKKTRKKPVSQIATIYNLNFPEKTETGVLLYHDERNNEIVIDVRPPFTRKDIEDNHWDTTPWVKSINLDSGVVVEIANVEKKFVDEIYNKYEKNEQLKFNRSSANLGMVGSPDFWLAQASELEVLLDHTRHHP